MIENLLHFPSLIVMMCYRFVAWTWPLYVITYLEPSKTYFATFKEISKVRFMCVFEKSFTVCAAFDPSQFMTKTTLQQWKQIPFHNSFERNIFQHFVCLEWFWDFMWDSPETLRLSSYVTQMTQDVRCLETSQGTCFKWHETSNKWWLTAGLWTGVWHVSNNIRINMNRSWILSNMNWDDWLVSDNLRLYLDLMVQIDLWLEMYSILTDLRIDPDLFWITWLFLDWPQMTFGFDLTLVLNNLRLSLRLTLTDLGHDSDLFRLI